MEGKKNYETPKMDVVELKYPAVLLEDSCGGQPCPEEVPVGP